MYFKDNYQIICAKDIYLYKRKDVNSWGSVITAVSKSGDYVDLDPTDFTDNPVSWKEFRRVMRLLGFKIPPKAELVFDSKYDDINWYQYTAYVKPDFNKPSVIRFADGDDVPKMRGVALGGNSICIEGRQCYNMYGKEIPYLMTDDIGIIPVVKESITPLWED